MQSDHFWGFPFVEMATNRIPDAGMQFLDTLCFGKNGLSEGARRKPPFRRFLNNKDDLVHSEPLTVGDILTQALWNRTRGGLEATLTRRLRRARMSSHPE